MSEVGKIYFRSCCNCGDQTTKEWYKAGEVTNGYICYNCNEKRKILKFVPILAKTCVECKQIIKDKAVIHRNLGELFFSCNYCDIMRKYLNHYEPNRKRL